MSAKNSEKTQQDKPKKDNDKHDSDHDLEDDEKKSNDSNKDIKGITDRKEVSEERAKIQTPAKKKVKVKQKSQSEKDAIIEELQRDVFVRDDTIKDQNILIVELESKLKDALEKAQSSK